MESDATFDPAASAADPPLGGASLDDLEAHLRHADPDRWLAARLIGDPAARAEVVALYALYEEIAGVAARVSQPLMGEMRLAWWSEQLDRAEAGGAPEHPVLRAVAPALRACRLRRAFLDRMLAARHADLEPAPFVDESALVAYFDDTSGALMQAAAVLLDPGAEPATVVEAGRAWGWSELLSHEPRWRAAGRRWAPAEWTPNGGEVPPDTLAARATERGRAALKRARRDLGALPVASFPAVAYVRLTRARFAGREPGELGRRAALLWSAFIGRV